jgi:hypothetical protein
MTNWIRHTTQTRGPRPAAIIAVTAALLTAAAPSLAQNADDPVPLGGPKVETRDAERRHTLVERDFDGKLKRVDDPVVAALELLDLSDADRAAAQDVLDARAAAMDALVRDHLKEIAELASARQSGDQAAARRLLADLLQKAKPITSKGTVLEQVKAVLSNKDGAELERLVKEYTAATVADRADNSMGDPGARKPRTRVGQRVQAQITERLTGLGAEIKRSYERVFGGRAGELQEAIATLGLSPEQESKVQRIFTDLFQKTYGKPTRTQSTKAFLDAYALMNDEQKARLRELIAERMSPGRNKPAAAKPADKPAPTDIPTPRGE